jgi:hypothetical protein
MKHDHINTHQRSDQTLKEINTNTLTKEINSNEQDVMEFTLQEKLDKFQSNKESFIDKQN